MITDLNGKSKPYLEGYATGHANLSWYTPDYYRPMLKDHPTEAEIVAYEDWIEGWTAGRQASLDEYMTKWRAIAAELCQPDPSVAIHTMGM